MGGGENWTLSVSIDIEDLYRDWPAISSISPFTDGAAEQDAPPTGWVEAKTGRLVSIDIALRCSAGSRGRGKIFIARVKRKQTP